MIRIRPATRDDAALILRFIRALATYEREAAAVVATEASLRRDGFGPSPRFFVLFAELEATPIGFAFYFYTYSTWEGAPVLHLEDLFVAPEHRGKGAGVALMQHLAAEATKAGCTRFEWQVLDWNEPAIRFYESLGGETLEEWRTVRLTGEALGRLAAQARVGNAAPLDTPPRRP